MCLGSGGIGEGRVTGHGNFGTCKSCGRGLGKLDAAIDSLCALCRIDLPKLKCIECGRKAITTRERWTVYKCGLFCSSCAELTE